MIPPFTPQRYLSLLRRDALSQQLERSVAERRARLKQTCLLNKAALDRARKLLPLDRAALSRDIATLRAAQTADAERDAVAQLAARWGTMAEASRKKTGIAVDKKFLGVEFEEMSIRDGGLVASAARLRAETASKISYQPLPQNAASLLPIGTIKKIAVPPARLTEPYPSTKTAPFTEAGSSGGSRYASSDAQRGRLYASGHSIYAGAVQARSFIAQSLPVIRGTRRLSVTARFSRASWDAYVLVILGFGDAECAINLRVMDGSRILASDRIRLAYVSSPFGGESREAGSGSQTLRCELSRDYPEDISDYIIVAEAEVSGGIGSVSGVVTAPMVSLTLSSFDIVFYP